MQVKLSVSTLRYTWGFLISLQVPAKSNKVNTNATTVHRLCHDINIDSMCALSRISPVLKEAGLQLRLSHNKRGKRHGQRQKAGDRQWQKARQSIALDITWSCYVSAQRLDS